MASNFRIGVRRKDDCLYIKLAGDFDGSSACELLNALAERCNSGDRVFIHTSGLKKIHRFGQDTFQKNLYTMKNKRISLIFTGKRASQMAPEPNKCCECYYAGGTTREPAFGEQALYPLIVS